MLVGPVFTLFYEQGWPSVSEWNAGGDYGQLILRSELFVQGVGDLVIKVASSV